VASASWLFELARVLVCFNHVARIIVNANDAPLFEIARVLVCFNHVAAFVVNVNHNCYRLALRQSAAPYPCG
jgi:hypothetical protein